MSEKSLNLTQELFTVTRNQKEQLNGHRSFVLWLTGLSASGKSTIARQVEERLYSEGLRTIILDGDNTRIGINKDLDFTAKGREENLRRVAEISSLMNSAGVVVIASFISPFIEDRAKACSIIGKSSFIEVFVDAPLKVCVERDPKGLYRKALDGEIENFTGVSSPYEAPLRPDIHLKTDEFSPQESVNSICSWLAANSFIPVKEISKVPADIGQGK